MPDRISLFCAFLENIREIIQKYYAYYKTVINFEFILNFYTSNPIKDYNFLRS